MPRKGRLIIGAVARPHGLSGEAKFNSRLVGNLDITNIGEVTIIPGDGPPETRRLLKARQGTKGWILKFEGIDTPEEVKRLAGALIEIDASYLPPAQDGEYYHEELIGLVVTDARGERLGVVKAIIPRAGQDLLAIDVSGREVLVPAVEPIVSEIRLEEGVIVIDPPEGLLE